MALPTMTPSLISFNWATVSLEEIPKPIATGVSEYFRTEATKLFKFSSKAALLPVTPKDETQ